MRILHVIPSLSPKIGGPTQAVLNFVRSLRELGMDCEIATTDYDVTGSLDVPLYQRVEYGGVPVWFFPGNINMKEFIPSMPLTKWLCQHLGDYDLVHTHYLFSYVSTVAGMIARWYKVPYIVRTIGNLTPWAMTQSRLRKQVYMALFERHNLDRAAAIHCTTTEEAADIQNYGITTPKLVLPLGVQMPTVIPQAAQKLRELYDIPQNTPIVLFLSRLHYKKRPDLLIQAITRIFQEGQNVHLILAGSGDDDYAQELHELVRANQMMSQITFIGFVAGADKDLLLQGADIFALFSYSENFGIAVAEALAAGLPVVITPDIQIAAAVTAAQAGLIVPGELAAAQSALKHLLSSPDLRHQLGNNGQVLAQSSYNWPAIATQLVQAYTSILEPYQEKKI